MDINGYQKDIYGRLSTWVGSQKVIYGSLWIITDGYPFDLVLKWILMVIKRLFTVVNGYVPMFSVAVLAENLFLDNFLIPFFW